MILHRLTNLVACPHSWHQKKPSGLWKVSGVLLRSDEICLNEKVKGMIFRKYKEMTKGALEHGPPTPCSCLSSSSCLSWDVSPRASSLSHRDRVTGLCSWSPTGWLWFFLTCLSPSEAETCRSHSCYHCYLCSLALSLSHRWIHVTYHWARTA